MFIKVLGAPKKNSKGEKTTYTKTLVRALFMIPKLNAVQVSSREGQFRK